MGFSLFLSVQLKIVATANKGEGDEVYDVDVDDSDGDAVFYAMSTAPNTDLFDIGYSDYLTQSSIGCKGPVSDIYKWWWWCCCW